MYLTIKFNIFRYILSLYIFFLVTNEYQPAFNFFPSILVHPSFQLEIWKIFWVISLYAKIYKVIIYRDSVLYHKKVTWSHLKKRLDNTFQSKYKRFSISDPTHKSEIQQKERASKLVKYNFNNNSWLKIK